MYEHAVDLYKEMEKTAKNGLYTGTKTGAYRAVGISQTYYTPLFRALEEMGSISVEYVGGRGKRVHIHLNKRPDAAEFAEAWRLESLTKGKSRATLESDVEAIRRRLPDIDIGAALLNIEGRLKYVEEALDKLKGG